MAYKVLNEDTLKSAAIFDDCCIAVVETVERPSERRRERLNINFELRLERLQLQVLE